MCRIFEEIQDEKATEIAREMLKDGNTIEKIAKYTRLPEELIKK